MTAPEWSTACPDWERRIVDRRSLIRFEPLFPSEAHAALEVFKSLRVIDAAGRPTFGEVAEPFILDFVAAIFGAYDATSARRYISQFLLLISKKNGKSTLAAGVMLTALIRNWRHLQELLILAPTIETASNSFAPAAAMVRADPELMEILKPVDHQRLIRHLVTGAELKVVAADKDVVAGKKAGFVLVEELWLFGKKPKAGDVLLEATGGLSARPEGFVIYLSTHSDEPPAGVFKAKLKYAREVRDGLVVDPGFLPVLYEWPEWMLEEKAYRNPENFYVTNPNLGLSVQRDWIVSKIAEAERGEGDSLQTTLSKFLNVEIGTKLRSDRWRGADYWDDAVEVGLSLDEILRRSEVVVVGIDGGGLDDLLGLAVLGRCHDTQRLLLWTHAWCHRKVLDLRKEIATKLVDLANVGDLTIVENAREAGRGVADIVVRINEARLLPAEAAIGVDASGFNACGNELDARGVGGMPRVVTVGQGYRLNGAILGVEVKLADGEIVHCGQELMAWCVGNARAELKGSAWVIEKAAAGIGKIDALIATLNAYWLMDRNPTADAGGSYLDEPEAEVLFL